MPNIELFAPAVLPPIELGYSAIELWKFAPVPVVVVGAPVVTSVTPSSGSIITPASALGFHVTDTTGLLFIVLVIMVLYPDGSSEVVFDGQNFEAPFAGLSTQSSISGGSAFSVARLGGWLQSPSLRVYAADNSGVVNS